MSEMETAEAIAGTLAQWQMAEHNNSTTDGNGYLDKIEWRDKFLPMAATDPENQNALKTFGHLNRMRRTNWGREFRADPHNDFASARYTFGVQMLISGCFKNQCYVQARDQADFNRRKYAFRKGDSPLGVDIYEIVARRLDEIFDRQPGRIDLLRPVVSVTQVLGQTDSLNHTAEKTLIDFHARAAQDIGWGVSESAAMLCDMQREWLRHATSLVILAAGLRDGDISAVPLLKPRSITTQTPADVTYPFPAIG